jgi:aryl carrier-like protein
LERLVADVWRQTLNLRQLTVKDHFFDLGGHSISAAQSVAKLVDILEVPLTLADLFRAPTIEAFVPLVESVATDHEALLETAELYFELQSSPP